jgi:hypothetical protein
VLKKKGQGQLIMVSGFICEQYGNLVLPDDLMEANAMLPPLEHLEVTNSCVIIYTILKEGGDDYWNTKQMLKQVCPLEKWKSDALCMLTHRIRFLSQSRSR